MFILNPQSGTPIYRQLIDQIRRDIASGQLQAGETLPSVRQLAAEHAVNPMTISKAYGLLEREGLLERNPGKPMSVAAPAGRAGRAEHADPAGHADSANPANPANRADRPGHAHSAHPVGPAAARAANPRLAKLARELAATARRLGLRPDDAQALIEQFWEDDDV